MNPPSPDTLTWTAAGCGLAWNGLGILAAGLLLVFIVEIALHFSSKPERPLERNDDGFSR